MKNKQSISSMRQMNRLRRELDVAIKEVEASCQCNWKKKRCDACTEACYAACLTPKKFLAEHNAKRMADSKTPSSKE